MADIQELIQETAAEPPCGPDLTYDNDFQSLENAARGKAEQQFGETVIPAEPPDWRDVERQSTALMQRTKDLRVAALLCHAWTTLQGLPGTAQGLQLCAQLLDRYWDSLHPLPEDGDDYFMRMNALGMLSDVTGFLRDLRNVEFMRGALGQVSVRDAESLARGNPPEDAPNLSADELRMATGRAYAEGHPGLLALEPCVLALDQIQAVCEKNLPSHQMPELASLRNLLQALRMWIPAAQAHTDAALEAAAADLSQGTPAAQPGQAAAQPVASYQDREQAIALLLKIADHVERAEPANPAPLFIRRAARLMRMNFIEILKELSPDSVNHIETLTGRTEQS